MIYSINDLLQTVKDGKKYSYLYFWGHTMKGSVITKSCLSQWYPSSFIIHGQNYPTAEHYMMAEKARMFNDLKIEKEILSTTDPAVAKKLGRNVKNFNDNVWSKNAFNIVTAGNYEKFKQNVDLLQFLLSTDNKILVEASPYDVIWGIGLKETDKDVDNPLKWKGKNQLGFALMKVREMLK